MGARGRDAPLAAAGDSVLERTTAGQSGRPARPSILTPFPSLVFRDLDAPVLRSSFLRLVAGDRLGLAPALGRDAARLDALVLHVVGDRLRAPLRQLLVVGVGADRVGVALDQHADARVPLQLANDLVDLLLALRLQDRLVEVEVGVGGKRDLLVHRRRGRRRRRRRRRRSLFRRVAEHVADQRAQHASTHGATSRGSAGVRVIMFRVPVGVDQPAREARAGNRAYHPPTHRTPTPPALVHRAAPGESEDADQPDRDDTSPTHTVSPFGPRTPVIWTATLRFGTGPPGTRLSLLARSSGS